MREGVLMLVLVVLLASAGLAEAQMAGKPMNGQMPMNGQSQGNMSMGAMNSSMCDQCKMCDQCDRMQDQMGSMPMGNMPMDGRMGMSYGLCGLENCFLIGPLFEFAGRVLFSVFHGTGMMCMRLAMQFVK
jgi:hypothetical protein